MAFLNPNVTINNFTSSVDLTTQNNALYENGIRVATTNDITVNALYSGSPLIPVVTGEVVVATGANAFEATPNPNLLFNNKTLTIGHSTVKESNSGALVLGGW
jgi:hypothetical protein